MRKLLDQERLEKKKQRGIVIWGVMFIVLMLLSTLGYAFLNQRENPTEKIIYRGYKFSFINGYWISQINNFIFYSSISPKNLTQINSTINGIGEYINQLVYVYSEEENSRTDVYRNLYDIATRIQDACIKEPCEKDVPLKNCTDSKIFIITESNETKTYQVNGCVYIEGKREELIYLTDSVLFKIFTI